MGEAARRRLKWYPRTRPRCLPVARAHSAKSGKLIGAGRSTRARPRDADGVAERPVGGACQARTVGRSPAPRQDRMIERMFVALLARGHCLLEGVPGVAKTLAVETVAKVVGGTFARIQFTPDLVPADIVGTRIYRQSAEKFDVELGPVFV